MYFSLIVLITCFFLNFPVWGLSKADFYEHPTDAKALPKVDDVSTEEIHLKVPITLYGSSYKSIYINSNGLLSFQTEIPSFFNYEFPLDYPIIAPLYSNVDTRTSGIITYSEITNNERLQLHVKNKLAKFFKAAQDFQVKSIFLVTWLDCGYHDNKYDKLNSFQVAIFSNGTESFVEFLYPVNGIQWIQGTGSESGLPDARAQAGFIGEDGRYYTLKGSGTNQVQYLEKWSNMNIEGDWLFRVGNLATDINVESPDLIDADKDNIVSNVSCIHKQLQCHELATCYDFKSGFCCKCSVGFYGNGNNCLKNDIPLRVNGKLRGEVNGIKLDELDVQSYVIMSDGRIYTAVSRMVPEIGFDLQLINILGEILGWIFAKPLENTKNGYDLTGGYFDHKATIKFQERNNYKLEIEHEFFGLDIFDQLRFEANIRGNVPTVDQSSKISIFDYDQVMKIVKSRDGLIVKFGGERTAQLTDQLEQFTYIVEQEIMFNTCRHDEDYNKMLEMSNWKFKVVRNYVGYEKSDQIIRYGMSTKFTSVHELDPCVEGRQFCSPNSVCVSENDNFQCVCRPGFNPVESEHGNKLECQDIDECEMNQHNCHENASCINDMGRYLCFCNPGYVGDGISCEVMKTCSEMNCSIYAECIPNYVNGPSCVCRSGYRGDGVQCIAEIEVTSVSNRKTTYGYDVTIYCQSWPCNCPKNYTWVENSRYCRLRPETTTTISDCRVNSCPENSYCTMDSSLDYRYVCECNEGYELDGQICIKIKTDCIRDGCPLYATCKFNETINDYNCVCSKGFKLIEDICLREIYNDNLCMIDSDCLANQECILMSETQRNECICKDGYYLDNSGICMRKQTTCGGAMCLKSAKCLYDDEVDTYYCQCASGLIGDGVHECKPKPLGCDVTQNCAPNATCTYNSHDGYYQCVCNEKFYGDGFMCSRSKTCLADPYMCHYQATCIFNAEKQLHECQCNSGFIGNGTVCKSMTVFNGNFLVVNQGMATIKIPKNRTKEMSKPIKIHNFQIAVGISVDCHDGRIYWSDINGRSIQSFNYNGSDDKLLVDKDILSPEGISVDWVSRNIYWTDSKKDTIEVMNIYSMNRKVIVKDGLVNPRGIAVHPQRGKVFWGDWNRLAPKIEWSNMDGSDRSIFSQGDHILLPNSLAIDWQNELLCYSDAGTKAIECITIDNRDRKTIIKNLAYPFGLAISDLYYYWGDWITGKVGVVDKQNLKQLESIDVPLNIKGNKLYAMSMVPNECPRLTNACHFYQCSSSHICLPNGINSRVCSCADNIDNADNCRDNF